MKDLKKQLESARKYALERIQKGEFYIINAYFDEDINDVRCTIEIDEYEMIFIVVMENNFMFQSAYDIKRGVSHDIILFNKAIEIPTRIKELAEERFEEYNSNKKELEIKRLEEKLNKLKNQ